MNFIILLTLALFTSFPTFADLSPEGNIIPGSVIRASDFNQTFNSLKLRLLDHGYEVQFDEFSPGEVISAQKINQQLNKIPLFIDDSQRNNLLNNIGSGNLNSIFSYLDNAIVSYENILNKFSDNYNIPKRKPLALAIGMNFGISL